MEKDNVEGHFYTIENSKDEYFSFIERSFCFSSYWTYMERHITIKPKDLDSLATFLGTGLDQQEIIEVAKIKFSGIYLDDFRIILDENKI